ncbi:MAG: LysR family transcriptional regulator substrate-binding protein, partial [Pseudomonadota bacterium]
GRGRAVEPTARGRAFAVDARRLLAMADEMAGRVVQAAEPPPIRLGTTATFALSVMPEALRVWRAEIGQPGVVLKVARSHEMRDLLDGGEIDIALVLDQGRHPKRVRTATVALGWAVGDGFAPATDDPLALAFLADARDLRRHALAALDREGRTCEIETHDDPVALRATVQSGAAATIMPAFAIVKPLHEGLADLPTLGTALVSTYAREARRPDQEMRLADLLLRRIGPAAVP